MTDPCRVCGQPLQFLDEPRRGSCGPCYSEGMRRWRALFALGTITIPTWPWRD